MTSSTVALTDNGLNISRTVVGMMRLNEWGLSDQALLAWVEQCLALGVTTFDHADIYGGYSCEEIFGRALALKPSLREQMQLISKCDIMLITPNRPEHRIKHYDSSRQHIITSVENSLRLLQTEYLDVLLIHRPDPLMDADELSETLTELHLSGKVKAIGVSNFTPWQVELLASRLNIPLVTNQIEISVMHLDPLHDGTLDQCQQRRIPAMAWSPLGGQRLFVSDEPQAQRLREVLHQIGQQHNGATLDQVALAWLIRHPVEIVPVLGTGKIERVAAAVAAEKIHLTRQEWFAIWQASAGHEVA